MTKKGFAHLPSLIEQKLTKTGYTRGATTREIFQNRVSRNNTVLIPRKYWEQCRGVGYEKGYIVLVDPSWYFEVPDAQQWLETRKLKLGINALLLYLRREDWVERGPGVAKMAPPLAFTPAVSRTNPLGGTYFARVHATTSDDGDVITVGFDTKKSRGAGIRVYEYASGGDIARTKLQLEALIWMCEDAEKEMVVAGMDATQARERKARQLAAAGEQGLLDEELLQGARILDASGRTVCPLCLDPIQVTHLVNRSIQAEGRETYDLTTTQASLFHVRELRIGQLGHVPYNLGWGHHHCNVVAKDDGIANTIAWMKSVIARQPTGTTEKETAAG